ncbi:amylo-alpha-1,6-glucosidase [Melioribacteraceae bacterium 4301-Me]|uniref:amylo-alpha-1,6-glucosidase n=1 Tax=Pyranulibacter aquaticus TaxID=3163344 RepID=UPI0035974812
MKTRLSIFLLFIFILNLSAQENQKDFVPKFELKKNEIELSRIAQPTQYFDRIGRKAALMGYEDGTFEMWVWPWKPLRNFQLQFFVESSTTPIQPKDILKTISVTPEVATLTFSYESFTIKEIIMVPVNEKGAIILLDVNTTVPLTIVPGFLPVMQPQWPAGIGGQYSYWDDNVKGYIISEGRQRALFICGSPLGKQMTAPPAHMFADNPLQFKIEIKPNEVKNFFVPIIIAGGINAKYSEVKSLYDNLWQNAEKYYQINFDYYKNLRDNTVNIITPKKKLNLAYEWSKVALHNLMVNNPNLGYGMVAGYGLSGGGGRPGFAWFFGGDCFINSLSFNSIQDFNTVRDALKFTQKWQRQDNFPIRKNKPNEVNKDIGKMAHELSQSEGLIDWWNDYHFGYNHADTTPWYLVAIGDYYHQSGDLDFIRQSWNSIKQAYKWCLSKDSDGDGLMDLKGAGLGVLEFGKYVNIYADFYTSAIWTKGIEAVIEMSDAVGDLKLKADAELELKKALKAMEEKFWMPKKGIYSYGATEKGEQVDENTPWTSTGMKFKVLDDKHSIEALKKMTTSELITDWGVRSLSNKSELYDPANYNYGAVWPFISTLMTRALYNYNFSLSAYKLIQAIANHFFDNGLGVVAEVFSGNFNSKLAEGYHDQGFSAAGFTEPFVRGLIGLDVNAPKKTIYFSPNLPADWDSLLINNVKIGNDVINLKLLKNKNSVKLFLENKGNNKINFVFTPALGLGTIVKSVTLNGKSIDYKFPISEQAFLVKTAFELEKSSVLDITINPSPEIYLLPLKTDYGGTNNSLNILYQELKADSIITYVEGKSGNDYLLGLKNANLVNSVIGGELQNDFIRVSFKNGNVNEFIRKKIVLTIKK